MAKSYHPGGRLQDLLVKNAGTKDQPVFDKQMSKLLNRKNFSDLHSAASRAMRDNASFHATWDEKGNWIYFIDDTSRNRLIDEKPQVRSRRITQAASSPIDVKLPHMDPDYIEACAMANGQSVGSALPIEQRIAIVKQRKAAAAAKLLPNYSMSSLQALMSFPSPWTVTITVKDAEFEIPLETLLKYRKTIS